MGMSEGVFTLRLGLLPLAFCFAVLPSPVEGAKCQNAYDGPTPKCRCGRVPGEVEECVFEIKPHGFQWSPSTAFPKKPYVCRRCFGRWIKPGDHGLECSAADLAEAKKRLGGDGGGGGAAGPGGSGAGLQGGASPGLSGGGGSGGAAGASGGSGVTAGGGAKRGQSGHHSQPHLDHLAALHSYGRRSFWAPLANCFLYSKWAFQGKIAPWVKSKGHFEYIIQRSRDLTVEPHPAFKYDTLGRFFGGIYKGKMEIYLIMGMCGLASAMAVGIMSWSLGKQEIWLDRSRADPPWDWGRIRTHYWKNNARFFNFEKADGVDLERRMPLMETLNDEMLEAAIRLGTRNPDGSTKKHVAH